jgi:hypothetical protein
MCRHKHCNGVCARSACQCSSYSIYLQGKSQCNTHGTSTFACMRHMTRWLQRRAPPPPPSLQIVCSHAPRLKCYVSRYIYSLHANRRGSQERERPPRESLQDEPGRRKHHGWAFLVYQAFNSCSAPLCVGVGWWRLCGYCLAPLITCTFAVLCCDLCFLSETKA